MASKIFVILALVCYVVLAKVEGGVYIEDEASYGNKVDDLLRKLKEAVDKAMVQAQKALDDARALLAAYAVKFEGEADTKMTTNEKTLLDQLQKLKAQAVEKNVTITECLGDNETKFNNLPTIYHTSMDTCVNGDIADGTKYAQGALDKIKILVNEIENIKQEIKDCGSGVRAAKCLAKLAIKIEQDITNLPTEIEAAATETALAIAKLQPKVKNCASDSASNCVSEEQKVFDIMSTCIKAKINN